MGEFSYCETVTAGPMSPWHIRQVGPEGVKLGGGLHVSALCGRELRGGWDLTVPVDAHSLNGVCAACLQRLSAHPNAASTASVNNGSALTEPERSA